MIITIALTLALQDAMQPSVKQDGKAVAEKSEARLRSPSPEGEEHGAAVGGSFRFFNGDEIKVAPEGHAIYQDGTGADADVDFGGAGNRGAIRQSDDRGGADGSKAVLHFRNDSAMASDSEGYIEQRGDRLEGRAVMTGKGHAAFILQDHNADGSGAGSVARIELAGEKNRGELVLRGEGGEAEVKFKGTEARGRIDQRNANAVASINGDGVTDGSAKIVQTGGGLTKADVDMAGRGHIAFIDQEVSGGGTGIAGIDQSTSRGNDNHAKITQGLSAGSGTDNADIDQGGSGNRAAIEQSRTVGSTGHTASITQPGNQGDALVRQEGGAAKADIGLGGSSNRARIEQRGGRGRVPAEASISADDGATDSGATILQLSGGVKASIAQSNQANNAWVVQANRAPQRGSVTADVDQEGGVQNKARITQRDKGTTRSAVITQQGHENEATLEQRGAADGITGKLQTTGRGNVFKLAQTATGKGQLQFTGQQQGDGNEIHFRQEGEGLSATVSQNGNNNVAEIEQTGRSYAVTVKQDGDNNRFRISWSRPAEGGGDHSVVQSGGETGGDAE